MIGSAFWSFIGQCSDPLSETSETDSASETEPNTETLPLENNKKVVTILPKRYLKLKTQLNEGLIAPLIDVKPPPNFKKFNSVMQDGELIKKRKKYYVVQWQIAKMFRVCDTFMFQVKNGILNGSKCCLVANPD